MSQDPAKKKYFSAPKEVNTVFGDEAHEVEEPQEVTTEKLKEELQESDKHDD